MGKFFFHSNRRNLQGILVRLLICIVAFTLFSPKTFAQVTQESYGEGKITAIKQSKLESEVLVLMYSGPDKGKTVPVKVAQDPKSNAQGYAVGEKVVIQKTVTPDGKPFRYISDIVRTPTLIWLFCIFVAVVLVIGQWGGVLSLFAMGYSFLILIQFVVPSIAGGNDPVLISILGGILITPVSYYLSHGFNTKTTVSIVGTVIALLFTGVLSVVFVNLAHLTGFNSDESVFVQSMVNSNINMRDLLLAGIIIGLLGILDDVTISQAGIVQKLSQANAKWNGRELFFHSMDIGRDHIASLVNTLFLVYAGSSLPLLLLFSQNGVPLSQVLSSEIVATEIVRTLIGSIGLIAAVPITTAIMCIVVSKVKS